MKKTACDHYVYTNEEASKWYRRVLYFGKDFGLFALVLLVMGLTLGVLFWGAPQAGAALTCVFAVLMATDAMLWEMSTFKTSTFYPVRRSLSPLSLDDWKVLKALAEQHADVQALIAAALNHGRTVRGRDFDAVYGIVERRRKHERKVLDAEKEATDRLAGQQAEAAAVAEIQQSLQDAHERAREKA
ncbi:hypothetical protein [Ancylobacter oerskovii]|uniref:Uncharacterized protein n=1 Tax=Ancylobacter oerskovii TaxID=459519 RepID=A0ABW4Z6N3_9HYPH|nr:hypothetical protein [Ancylobacter oerskovii]MBS7545547.1 hypothetical protein [Ancylobacter oerskovii]